MSWLQLRPSKRLIQWSLVWLSVSLALGVLRLWVNESVAGTLNGWWWFTSLVFVLVTAWDAASRQRKPALQVDRRLPAGLSVGTNNSVDLVLTSQSVYPIRLTVTELVSEQVRIAELPLTLTLAPDEEARVPLTVHPLKRGDLAFDGVDVLVTSRWGLWLHRQKYLEPEVVRVFPNFTAISHFELLAHGQQTGQLGIHMNQRRGEGLDFHQLREFRSGDSLRQVDWKATSRTLKPISREYQDERDQDIIFLMDNGRKMRAQDGELSHFDHCLNAVLMTAYIALRQGDAVGLMTFGDQNKWVPPIKGKNNLSLLLDQVYGLHSSLASSDYIGAAQQLMTKHRKRALVVIISNVNDQDEDDLLAAYQLIQKNHLVIFACLRESKFDQVAEKPVRDFEHALEYTSATEFQINRLNTLKKLQTSGALVIDDLPSQMHIGLVNQYLALKRSGRI